MTKIFINLSKGYKMQSYYINAYKDLYNNYGIITYVFFDKNLSKELFNSDTKEYKFFYYDSKKDLLNQLKQIKKEEIYFINTFDEMLVLLLNEIKQELGFEVSKEYKAFRNKNLQRELLFLKFPETTVSYFDIDINDDFENYTKLLSFPFIIKPTSGMQSAGVLLINSKNDLENYIINTKNLLKNMGNRGINDTRFIIEEFIDGEMYTVDYYVDNNGNFIITIITKVFLLNNLGIDDFGNYVRVSGDFTNLDIDLDKLKDFIKKHIKTFGIKDTFIHHEFKINSKNIFKTIELNQRVGGYRLEMAKLNYDYNVLTSPLGIRNEFDNKSSMAIFIFYPKKTGVFKELNNKLLDKFKSLKSFNNLRFSDSYIGKTIGLTKDGYSNVAAIRIINKDLEQFKKDYDFIEKNYNDLIILE
ncbi:MAG: ATP-grasp domain-containing protein [Candidatus Gracilibacteria bacterium]|nr:ATP-grasp domain-containing protein [Candidatus Gracilibacteria bacterium]